MRVPVVPESDLLVWTGVVTNSEFARYAQLEFRVHVENDRALVSRDETPHSEQLGKIPAFACLIFYQDPYFIPIAEFMCRRFFGWLAYCIAD